METVATWWMWAAFALVVAGMLAADLFLLGRREGERISLARAGAWSIAWLLVALAFAGGLHAYLASVAGDELARERTLEFLTGYAIEKALAVDNVFVWLVFFSAFAVPPALQRRVLLYGVVGAIAMRAAMIFAGAWLLAEFHWVLYVFGALLLATGVKMLALRNAETDVERNPLLRFLRRRLRVSPGFDGERFVTVRDGVRYATPLLLVLVLVEASDLVFAIDSIPAIFAITSDPFIVLTSNVFAILGLRAMYFLLRDVVERFKFLKHGLAFVLLFVGGKMLAMDVYPIPVTTSLAVVAGILAVSIAASMLHARLRTYARSAPRPMS